MSETYEKKDKDTLIVTRKRNDTHIFEEDRAEIQTQIDHLEADRDKTERDFKEKIDALKAKLAILAEGE